MVMYHNWNVYISDKFSEEICNFPVLFINTDAPQIMILTPNKPIVNWKYCKSKCINTSNLPNTIA